MRFLNTLLLVSACSLPSFSYALNVEPEDVIPLSKELEFISHFLFLNNIRFDNSIQTSITVSNNKQYIVPMALQLVFENAIKHNQFNNSKPLLINVEESDGYLKITNNKRTCFIYKTLFCSCNNTIKNI